MSPLRALPARLLLTALLAVLLVLAGAGPAAAHVEATAEGAQAGAGPVTVVFSAAAESGTAGIGSVETQLPQGVPPAEVRLAAGPPGWALTPTADGYEVGGPPLAPGVDAEYTISIGRLPPDLSGDVPFKTIVRYTDGSEDAWIELPTAGNPEPAMPAPVIAVAPAAEPSASTSSSAPATDSPATDSPATRSPAPASAEDGAAAELRSGASGVSLGLVVPLAVAAALLAGGLWWWRGRRGPEPRA